MSSTMCQGESRSLAAERPIQRRQRIAGSNQNNERRDARRPGERNRSFPVAAPAVPGQRRTPVDRPCQRKLILKVVRAVLIIAGFPKYSDEIIDNERDT
jgi:hypothetical protein